MSYHPYLIENCKDILKIWEIVNRNYRVIANTPLEDVAALLVADLCYDGLSEGAKNGRDSYGVGRMSVEGFEEVRSLIKERYLEILVRQ